MVSLHWAMDLFRIEQCAQPIDFGAAEMVRFIFANPEDTKVAPRSEIEVPPLPKTANGVLGTLNCRMDVRGQAAAHHADGLPQHLRVVGFMLASIWHPFTAGNDEPQLLDFWPGAPQLLQVDSMCGLPRADTFGFVSKRDTPAMLGLLLVSLSRSFKGTNSQNNTPLSERTPTRPPPTVVEWPPNTPGGRLAIFANRLECGNFSSTQGFGPPAN